LVPSLPLVAVHGMDRLYIYMMKRVGPETSPTASTWPVQSI
jgi:hypothetical protein